MHAFRVFDFRVRNDPMIHSTKNESARRIKMGRKGHALLCITRIPKIENRWAYEASYDLHISVCLSVGCGYSRSVAWWLQ